MQPVTIIVVNYNGGQWVISALSALRKQTWRNFVTLVVDNDSSDGSRENIAHAFPEVELITSTANIGFAAAVNLALAHIQTAWFALLNPDAIPEPDWLESLMSAAFRSPGTAAFASRQMIAGSADLLDGCGDVYHASGVPWRRGYGKPLGDWALREQPVFAACAAAALYRSEAVRQVGGMDATLFCYLEDVDLGFRLRLAGWECVYVPRAVVWHVGSAICGKRSDFQVYYGQRNVVWVFLKNMPTPLLWPLLPLHILANVLMLIVHLLRGQGRVAWQAKLDAVKGISSVWPRREDVARLRRIGLWKLLVALEWWPRRY